MATGAHSRGYQPTELNDALLWDLSRDLGDKWEEVGYILGLLAVDIERTRAMHPYNETKQAHSMLLRWRQRTPRSINKVEQLAEALKRAGLVEIVEKNLLKDFSTPTDIILQGPDAVKVFNDASSEGVGCDTRFRIIVIGQERSGKTSLIKLLTGRNFDPNEKTTHVTNVIHTKIEAGEWKMHSTNDGTYHNDQYYVTACEIAKKILENRQKNIEDTTEDDTLDELDELATTQQIEQEIATSGIDSKLSIIMMNLVKECLTNKDLYEVSIPLEVHFWDFGGQFFYYTTHQVLLSSAAIFIVVFDLTKKMSELSSDFTESGYTNGQVLEFWLNSIYGYVYPKGSKTPLTILLVGTHATSVSPQQKREAIGYIDNILKNERLRKMILQDNECVNNIFYAVENNTSLPNIDLTKDKDLKSDIKNKIIPRLMEERQKRPQKWLDFEKQLRSTIDNFSTLDKVQDIAVKCGVKDASVKETLLIILHFLHSIGVVLYYGMDDPALRDLVIVNPIWLLDILKKLIVVPLPGKKIGTLIKAWDRLEKSYILEDELINVLLGELKESKESIISIMKNFDLLCERERQGQVSYYAPFVFFESEKSEKEHELTMNKRISDKLPPGSDTIIHIDFHGFLPGGLFHRLVVRLLEWSKEDYSQKIHDGMSEPQISYGYVVANVDRNHVVSLDWMKPTEIKVVIKSCSESNDTFPEPSIVHFVLGLLKKNISELWTMGTQQDLLYDFYLYLHDYPKCRHINCDKTPKCRLQLQKCLGSQENSVTCEIHPTSRVFINSLLPRFKGSTLPVKGEQNMTAVQEWEFKILVYFQIMDSLTNIEYGKLKTLFTGPKLIGAGVADNLKRLEFLAKLRGLGLLSQTKLGPLKDALVIIKKLDLLPLINEYEVKYGLATASGGPSSSGEDGNQDEQVVDGATGLTTDGGTSSTGGAQPKGSPTQQDSSPHPHPKPPDSEHTTQYWIFVGLLVGIVAIALGYFWLGQKHSS